MQKPFQIKPLKAEPGRGLPYCNACGAYATNEAHFDVGNYIVLRRYCDKCLPTAEYDPSLN
ncbi:hypothetical protein NTE_00161 [Candidatus Nitrososphaera evergladensis SR1]|uniref:Uncharacterized protein n=1 Tax=Candidatus Nitrososphaera evergladensis SR1 TaxID=1459636 RepID=A0A075MLX9_9ARCH|nr:hypothetical protein NTE_00161 [Candidatus Nitrososphaera evergladensis SR1]